MKKIISILTALVLVLSLAACGGSNGGDGTTNTPSTNPTHEDAPVEKPTLTKYVNENALGRTDNITISIGSSENESEEFILNINAPDLLKDFKTIEDPENRGGTASMLANDILNLRLFRNPAGRFQDAYFTFQGYGEFKINGKQATSKIINGTTILEDGYFVLVENGGIYEIWAKDGDASILVDLYPCFTDPVSGEASRLETEEDYKKLFTTITEHFTFARIKTNKIEHNGLVFNAYDLNSVTVFGEDEASSNGKDWVFGCDILHQKLEKMGISLVTSYCLTSEGGSIDAPCVLAGETAESKNPKAIIISFSKADEKTFDMLATEHEFTIGDIQFREDTDRAGNDIFFIIKTSNGDKYECNIYPLGGMLGQKIVLDAAKEYLEGLIVPA